MRSKFDNHPFKREAERTFPWRVDIEVPPLGLGDRLTEMLGWCRARLAVQEWAQHGERWRPVGQAPREVVRFYFADPEQAEIFQTAWGGEISQREEAQA